MKNDINNYNDLKKVKDMLVQWGMQKSKIFEKSRPLHSDKKSFNPESQKMRSHLSEKETSSLPLNKPKSPQKKVKKPLYFEQKNQNDSFEKKLIIPKWHIPEQEIKKTDFYLIKFPDTQGLHFADILIITDDITPPSELESINYAIEQLLKSNIQTYKQCVGTKKGYVVPFSFLFLAPIRQKNQIDWPSLNHTIFVDWVKFSEKAESRKLLWSEICFFLNKRVQSCSSLDMPKLH